MKKILLIIIGIAALTIVMTSHSQGLHKPTALNYMTAIDTGKSLDSMKYIYPCGQGKFVSVMVTPVDNLGTDSLCFWARNPYGKQDTLAFKIWRNDSVKTVLALPNLSANKTKSISITFWMPYVPYEIVAEGRNTVYDALRKWILDWTLINQP